MFRGWRVGDDAAAGMTPPHHQRPDDRTSEQYLLRAFDFLVSDVGYTAIGRIPVATPEVDVRGWANAEVGIQVELSGSPIGVTFHGLLRRFVAGAPAPYADREHILELHDIALVREPSLELSHNMLGWEGTVDAAARLLRQNAGLLAGRDWITRRQRRRAWGRHMLAAFGIDIGNALPDASELTPFRERFAFLLDRGWSLVRDSDTLSPHEYGEPTELRYEKGTRSVRIVKCDPRDPEWQIHRDGGRFGGMFVPSSDEITRRAAEVAAAIDDEPEGEENA